MGMGPRGTRHQSGSPDADGFLVQIEDGLNGDVTVVVQGDIDLATAPLLWDHLAEAIPRAERRLVVDLRLCPFLDSCGLAVFVRAFKRLRHAGSDLILRAPAASPRKALRITALDSVMTIED